MAIDAGILEQLTLDGVQTHRRGMERVSVIGESAMQNGTIVANHTTQATAAMVATEIGSQNDPDRVAGYQVASGVPRQGAILPAGS